MKTSPGLAVSEVTCSSGGDVLDVAAYDLHCPLMGCANGALNYFKSSCRVRVAARGCSMPRCPERVVKIGKKTREGAPSSRPAGPVSAEEKRVTASTRLPRRCAPAKKGTSPDLDVTAGETALKPSGEVVMGKTKKPIKTCKQCQRQMTIVGRGLCGTCYRRMKQEGTLDDLHPSQGVGSPVLKAKKRTGKKAAVAAEKTEPVVDSAEVVAFDEGDFVEAPGVMVHSKPASFVEAFECVNVVCLELVTEADRALWSRFEQDAKEARRSVEQHLLYVVERYL